MKISVCLASYNGAKYIREQIESILPQLREGDELIVYDDCSIDLTVSIVKEYSSIKLIEGKENLGVIKSFSNVIGASVNDIIVLSDQDDIWLSGKLDRIREEFTCNCNAYGFLHNALVKNEKNNSITTYFANPPNKKLSIPYLLYSNSVIGCCFAFRSEIKSLALPIPRVVSMHDWWLASVVRIFGDINFSNDNFIIYRRHNSNLSLSSRGTYLRILKSRVLNMWAILILIKRLLVK